MRLFDRKTGRQAAILSEATGLLDDGLGLELVLGLFAADRSWLEPLLRTEAQLTAAAARTQPSYYFEASLKQKFVAAGQRRAQTPIAAPPPARPIRMTLAAGGVAAALAVVGAVSLGLITADDGSDEGDWDHVFRVTKDRVDDTLSRRGNPVEFHIRQTDARVFALTQQLASSEPPAVSETLATLDALQAEAREIKKLAEAAPFDAVQVERVQAIEKRVVEAAQEVKQSPNADTAVVTKFDETVKEVQAASAAAAGGLKPIPDPVSTETPTPSATPSATATATETPSATPTPTATETATPSETPAATPSASATPATSEPSPSAEAR